MDKQDDQVDEIIEQKITKVNGQTAFKRYQRGKMLGKGGFAKCYEGVNLQTKTLHAVKVIDKNTLQKNRAKQKLLSQIKIHKTLHHRYIVEFDSVFEDSKFVYIILELCKNKTMSEMVKKRKKLTPKQTRYFMHQLVSSIEYMHSNRVIHRDLKLGNIFLNDAMEIKVGDFGLATKLQFADQKKRTMCGTPNYIAPQIVQGSVGHSYQVDIWSAGVICFACLFGRPPFETNEVKMTYKKIKNCQYNFPNTSVPEDAKDFIKKILVLDPKQRMTTKQMMCHPFMTNEDIPKTLSAEALVAIPSFKPNDENEPVNTLSKVKSVQRLRPEDFGKKKLESFKTVEVSKSPQAKISQGLLSPRGALQLERQPSNTNFRPQEIDKKDEHKIHILAYVDYSKKYGLGYVINNKMYGVYFNDETLMSSDQKKERVYFLKNPTLKDEKIEEYTQENIPKERDFQKKYLLLDRFISHLNDELAKLDESKIVFQPFEQFVYMKQWLKTRHAIMFGLSNKLFQVNFFDNSQILLQTQKKTVMFTSKKGQATYETLSNVLNSQQNEMTRRITYTKEILNSIRKKKEDGGDEEDPVN